MDEPPLGGYLDTYNNKKKKKFNVTTNQDFPIFITMAENIVRSSNGNIGDFSNYVVLDTRVIIKVF